MVEWKKLGEVCVIKNGYTPSTKENSYWENGTLPWFTLEDIRKNGRILEDAIKHITSLGVKKGGLFPKDSIIVSTTATIGEYALIKSDFLCNQQITCLTIKTDLKEQLLPKYLYYLSDRIGKWCKKNVNGGGSLLIVSTSKLNNFLIPIPSIEEQNRIVGILDTFTASIDNLKEQIAQRRKQYEYYLSCFFSTEKWPENKIGELTKVFSCPRVFKDQWQDSGVPFWRSSDIMSYHNGVINPRGEVYISQSLYDELSSKSDKIKEGDILVTGGGSIGIPYLKKDNSPLFVKDADLICIQKCNSIIPKYLYHYFLSTDFKLYLKKITHDATIAHYTINQIKDTPIPLPPLKEQQRIVDILDKFEASIQNLEAQLSQREKQYEYYRNKLLTFE